MKIVNANGVGASANASATASYLAAGTAGAAGAAKTEFDQILDELKKIASQTPVERAIGAVLKKHGLTKETYNRLPAARKDVIAREIRDAVKRVVGADGLGGSDFSQLR